MIRLAVVGLGKMGLSHYAMVNAHPDVELVGICDSSGYALSVLKKYTGVATFSSFDAMLARVAIDAVIVATPSRSHAHMVRACLKRDIDVFCEKPFTLATTDAEALTSLARDRGRVTQVGYHNRFVGAFDEAKRLVDLGAIGEVTHVLGEAYGPVVLKPTGSTWRSSRSEGGGCLYDYAAHVINLVNWYLGEPVAVGGTVLGSVFSREIDDEVSSTMYYPGKKTAQISVNWSDESFRKMTTRLNLWGSAGRIFVDRQECQVYLRDTATIPDGYSPGWNVKYTTELTAPVWFYLRGEEYSAQLDAFVKRVQRRELAGTNDFESAAVTDRVISMMVVDNQRGPAIAEGAVEGTGARARIRWWRRLGRSRSATGGAV